MPQQRCLPDLRVKLHQALLNLSARDGRRVLRDDVAKQLGIGSRVELYFAARGDAKRGFGPNSERRKRLEKFIEEMTK